MITWTLPDSDSPISEKTRPFILVSYCSIDTKCREMSAFTIGDISQHDAIQVVAMMVVLRLETDL